MNKICEMCRKKIDKYGFKYCSVGCYYKSKKGIHMSEEQKEKIKQSNIKTKKLTSESPIARFLKKIKTGDKKDCWLWISGKTHHGYGVFWINRKLVRAHRFSYELFNNKRIPDSLTIDHLCKNTSCVNPNHLEAVTMKENVLRGDSPTSKNFRKTHCINGHELSFENIYLLKNKEGCQHRQCKICTKIRSKEHYTKMRLG